MRTRRKRFALWGATVCFVMAVTPAVSAFETEGRDFWLAFEEAYDTSGTLVLLISGDTPTSGTVEIPGLVFSQPFVVTPGQVTEVGVPIAAMMIGSDTIQDLGIHVVADHGIVVYGFNHRVQAPDSFTVLPIELLGDQYMVHSYTQVHNSEFAVVAIGDGTTVSITATADIGSHPAGTPFDVVLDSGQVFQAQVQYGNFTGTEVHSDRPVAVFSGNECTAIPQAAASCDHAIEQLLPEPMLGTHFFTVPLADRTGGDPFRFMATVDGTVIGVVGSPPDPPIDRGQYYNVNISAAVEIVATEPVSICQYAYSSDHDGQLGDPFMMTTYPVSLYSDRHIAITADDGADFPNNYLNLVVPDASVGEVLLDGVPVPPGAFAPIGVSGWSGAAVGILPGAHDLRGPEPFGAWLYGFNVVASYGHPAAGLSHLLFEDGFETGDWGRWTN